MVILDPNGMISYAVGVFGLGFQLFFKSCSSYCGWLIQKIVHITYYIFLFIIFGQNIVIRADGTRIFQELQTEFQPG